MEETLREKGITFSTAEMHAIELTNETSWTTKRERAREPLDRDTNLQKMRRS
jgi:hypothetical protein